MRPFEDVSVIIPAFNEAGGIGPTLEQLSLAVPGAEIIVVDDGSTDGTAEVVGKYPNVTLMRHGFNRGYGAALKTGMAHASRPLVAWFDADNEHRVSDLVSMIGAIRQGGLAAVIGQRISGGVSAVRGVGKAVILMLARSLGFRGGRDMNCGLRVFRTEVICRYLPLLPNGYSASMTSLLVMLERGYPIGYHPVELAARIGTSKVTLRAGFASLLLVMRVIMMFAPMRIFLPFALAMFSIGALYGATLAILHGEGFPTFGIFLMLAGLLIGMLGLIADQLSQMRLVQYETITPYRALPLAKDREAKLPPGLF
ncbi:glycosyltransferase family 2 protein [Bradyrhizobium hipponense]|uniref:glycosyltransferase family 2 protein n=1 Tax=Bradyrhizobium hipponense TaxID=2605638 RepID=UPI001653127E|nr:glycosyltransferase family 2 protein [Bradyrhizobium hipponense]